MVSVAIPIGCGNFFGNITWFILIAVAMPCSLIVLGLMLTSLDRLRKVKYWIALACSVQPIPVAISISHSNLYSSEMIENFSISMGVVWLGFAILAAWPRKRK
jgi:hypothetical protein